MIAFLVSAIRLGMTLLFGSTGETIAEKSGHLNLGIPGVMCIGAACGCAAESWYHSITSEMTWFPAVFIPIFASMIGGILAGLLYSFLTVTLRANQNVTGLAITTLGIGISKFMISKIAAEATFTKGSRFFTASLPFAKNLGWFGELFLSHGILIYLALAISVATALVLKKTRIGLHLRAVGENPATADAAGINVTLYRYTATGIGCGIAALGGLCYIMDYLNGNWEYVIDAMGWLAIALVIFTVWNPLIGIPGSIIFGAFYIMSSYIDGVTFATTEILKTAPYVVTIIVLIFTSIRNKRENQPPASLGLNYYREDR